MFKFTGVVTAALWLALVDSRLLQNPQDATSTTYDFIIVGGGTAGSVVASRLSETSAKVLLIEAGISSAGVAESVPFYSPQMTPNKSWDWNYTTTAQPMLNNRTVPFPRGKLLGGCSAVNFMIFNYGGSDDFNRIAKTANNDRWTWDSTQSYRKKLEGFTPPTGKSASTEYILADHGTNGPLSTSLAASWPTEIDSKVISATSQLTGFPYNHDMNSGNEIGIGHAYATIGRKNSASPNRTTSASAYLFPVIDRPNLDVLIQTQVTRLFQTSSVKDVPVFRGVEFSQGPQQTIYNITAKQEVIISAGAVGTPQILMLSGIGDETMLKNVGIQAIVNLTDVGNHLQDHPLLPFQYYVNSTNTWEADRDPTVAQQWADMYNNNGTGPLVNTLASQIGWIRVPNSSNIWQGQPDPSSGPTSGHYEMFFSNGFNGPIQSTPSTGNFMSITTMLVTPASRGSVKLTSSSPWDAPIIDPGYFSDSLDLRIMREALKSAIKYVTAPVFKGYIIKPYTTDPIETDADLDAYIRKWTSTVWHPAATAKISPDNSTDGVVDSKLNVKKLHGLRVVDASILPWVPAAHPEAAIYTIAEVASDIIKSDNGYKV